MPDDEPPTDRSSGTLAVFVRTTEEILDRLAVLPPSEEALDLHREAVALLALFRSWSVKAPEPVFRARSITRLMDLHRATEEYAAKRTNG